MKTWGQVLAAVLAIALGICSGFGAPGDGKPGESRDDAQGSGISRCLAVGYDHFVSLADTAPCSANNAEIMTALFRDFVPGAETAACRVNGPGTAEGLEALIRETFRAAAPGDTSYLYFSTHGVIWEEAGGTGMALMVSDGEREEALAPAQLRKILDDVPGEKVLILDMCHSGAALEAFAAPEYTVLASCGAEEDSFFWSADNAPETGAGYFTRALESALRASEPQQVDADGNGEVTLGEMLERISGIYGVSRAQGSAGREERTVFRLPEGQETGGRIRGLAFDPMVREADTLTLPFHFEVTGETRLEYRIIPKTNGKWDFSHFAVMPDRERTGTVRGLLSPGSKDRKIRISIPNLGEEGEVLLQVISLQGRQGLVPAVEGTQVIRNDGITENENKQ